MNPLKISIIGTGYVGLVSGTCLASKGHLVQLLDIRSSVVDSINNCKPPIYENGLEEILSKVVKSKHLKASLVAHDALENSDIIMICVGTPSSAGEIDLSQLKSASEFVGTYLKTSKKFVSVVVKSTVVPGTTDTIVKGILEETSGKSFANLDFGLGMNPEFLREGNAVEDFINADRIVIGADDPETQTILEQLYEPWTCDKLFVNSRTAEMIKYTNNCLLALQISAVNELANIASAIGGIDFMDVHAGVNLDKRWNPVTGDGNRVQPGILSYLIPGCGFGGSCFPKDVEAMRTVATKVGIEPLVLQAILDVNANQPVSILKPFVTALGGTLKNKKILLLGLAFKPGTDDIRESPALKIAKYLKTSGASVMVHDPIASQNALNALGDVSVNVIDRWQDKLDEADGIIVATRWPEYQSLVDEKLAIKGKIVLDARRMFSTTQFDDTKLISVGYAPLNQISDDTKDAK
jgi:UDPglucose 6-dehydrogenase/GDP-mannose 6-dehydrogenase